MTDRDAAIPDDLPTGGHAARRVLPSLRRLGSRGLWQDVQHKVRRAAHDYPELLAEVVTVAASTDWDDKLGRADRRNRIVYLPTDRTSSWTTVYHELAHLAIQVKYERGDDVPRTSEEFCSLFQLTRQPVDRLDEDRVPYFGEPAVDPAAWAGVAEAALSYREDHHDYVQQARAWLHGDDPLPEGVV